MPQNPAQTQRTLRTRTKSDRPAVSLVPTSEPYVALCNVLDRTSAYGDRLDRPLDVLILARYHFELQPLRDALSAETARNWPRLKTRVASAHQAKGSEADVVVTVGLQQGRNGFPAEKTIDAFEEAFLPPREPYPYAEERRLFYVALTRARKRVYLVYDRAQCSAFVDELADLAGAVTRGEIRGAFIQPPFPRVSCPGCATGQLQTRQGTNNAFHGCSRFPRCSYAERGCGVCGGILLRAGRYRVCADPTCPGVHLACSACGSSMEVRTGKTGAFYGCSKYGSKDPDRQCSNTEQMMALPQAPGLRAKYGAIQVD